MPHSRNIEVLAELLYRAEHWELGIAPPFERLTQLRQDDYRRKARFLGSRGVLVPAAVAPALHQALAAGPPRDAEELRELLERVGRAEA